MNFKYDYLKPEFELLHPKVRDACLALEAWLKAKDFPNMTVTHVLRTTKQQEEYYWRGFLKDMHGVEAEARKVARAKFSWHKVYCAADIRNNNFDSKQRMQILKFLKENRDAPWWEILEHDVGAGDHFHVGYKDFSWRKKWESQLVA